MRQTSTEIIWTRIRVGGLLLTETTTAHLLNMLEIKGYSTEEAVMEVHKGKISNNESELDEWEEFMSTDNGMKFRLPNYFILVNGEPYNLIPDENGIIGTYE